MKLASETIHVVERLTWLKEAPTAALETAPLEIRPEPDVARERTPCGGKLAIGAGQLLEGGLLPSEGGYVTRLL